MTASTPTAPSDPTVALWAAEVSRLEPVVNAGKDGEKAATARAQTAAAALQETSAQAALLQQEASVLAQRLAAATTGPERHAVELLLNANRTQQLHNGTAGLAATEKKALADAALTGVRATNQQANGDLQQARQELTAATTAAAGDAALVDGLTTDYAAAVARAGAVAGAPAVAALTRLGVLLGGDALVATVSRAIAEVRADLQRRVDAATAADAAVRAVDTRIAPLDTAVSAAQAELAAARAAATDAVQNGPKAVEVAATAVADVTAMVPPPEQPVIDAAARAVVAGARDTYDAWLVTLPDTLVDAAVRLLDAVHDLTFIADPDTLRRNLEAAAAGLVAALSARLAARRDRADKATTAAAARAAVDAVPAPADLHKAAFVSGPKNPTAR